MRQTSAPRSGKAKLLLRVAGRDVNLVQCKGAVALLISGIDRNATIYWFDADQCCDIQHGIPQAVARAEIEARCPEYELPPELT